MPKLNDFEKKLSEEELFFHWLNENKIDFNKLSNLYIKYLEIEKNKLINKNSMYSNLLVQFLQYSNLSKNNEWVKDKAIGTLYAYEDFKNAPIYETWKEIIEQNNINTNIDTLGFKVYKGE